jgi:hypothetical protein
LPLARLAVAALVLASALAARAGVLIEGTDGETPYRILAEGPRVRVETVGSHATVFDGAARRALLLDLANETYVELTKDDLARLEAAAKRTGAVAPAAASPPAARFERTGRTAALGRRCDVYRLVEGDVARTEICVAAFGSFGVERADLAGFRPLGALASEMTGVALVRSWADLPGVPLVSWELEDGVPRETFRATKLEKRTIETSEFTAPAGWKRNPWNPPARADEAASEVR